MNASIMIEKAADAQGAASLEDVESLHKPFIPSPFAPLRKEIGGCIAQHDSVAHEIRHIFPSHDAPH